MGDFAPIFIDLVVLFSITSVAQSLGKYNQPLVVPDEGAFLIYCKNIYV